jgi:hypothetical protein
LRSTKIKSIPYTPVSHPFVERLIGTIRREFLDQTLFWNSLDLEQKLEEFKLYYNSSRVHQSLGGVTPTECSGYPLPARAALASFGWKNHCFFAVAIEQPYRRLSIANSKMPADLSVRARNSGLPGLVMLAHTRDVD